MRRVDHQSNRTCLYRRSDRGPVLNRHKSIFYSVTAPNDFKMWTAVDLFWCHRCMSWPLAIVTSQWPNYFYWVSMDAFISQWHWAKWFKESLKYTCVPRFSNFIIERICEAVNCLASDVMINWPRATGMAQIMASIILQQQGSIRIMHRPRNLYTSLFNLFACFLFLFPDPRGSTQGIANHDRITIIT